MGVLVQSNFGGALSVAGAPVGREVRRRAGEEDGRENAATQRRRDANGGATADDGTGGDGSIMMVVATDAPLTHRNLERLGRRALAGLARTGSTMSNGSGDYVISFSTVPVTDLANRELVGNNAMSPLFQAAIEATEEAIYNSLFYATTVHGHRGTAEALPLDEVAEVLRRYGVIN